MSAKSNRTSPYRSRKDGLRAMPPDCGHSAGNLATSVGVIYVFVNTIKGRVNALKEICYDSSVVDHSRL